MDGILLVDKPKDWTSHDVVARVRSILRQSASLQSSVSSQQTLATSDKRQVTPSRKVKVGHTGTLDPLATGLLILVVGSYTKRAQEFSKMDKTYEVKMKLGETSTTGDPEGIITTFAGYDPANNLDTKGDITKMSDEKPSLEQIQTVLAGFVGEIEQVPPKFSAIKVDGQRAYKLAREGKEVKMEPRKVTVYRLELTGYEYPEVIFVADVSSGTYIRTLAEDIGKELGTGAYMSDLRRTQISTYKISDANMIDNLTSSKIRDSLLTID